MQLDGLSLYAASMECNALLCGGRVERIAQPSRQTVVFTIRANGQNHRLLFSCEPEAPRAVVVPQAEKGPEKPFTFLMILRKHLVHARIVSIQAPRCDRVLSLSFDALDDLGARVRLTFIAELMGKHSNLILVNQEQVILDCAKRIPPSVSSLRTVLPGDRYQAPPVQQKADLLSCTENEIRAIVQSFPAGRVSSSLVGSFYGVSPYAARLLCQRAAIEEDAFYPLSGELQNALCREILHMQSDLQSCAFAPVLLLDAEDRPAGFFPFVPKQGAYTPYPTMMAAMNAYYSACAEQKAIERQRTQLSSAVQTRLQKLYKRLSIQNDTLMKSENYERLRTEGDLILAYAYLVTEHCNMLEVEDYTQENKLVKLTYDPHLTPIANAEKRYKRYQKLRSACQAANQQKKKIQPEIDYLEEVLLSIQQNDSLDSLLEIRHELQDQDILPPNRESGQKRKTPQSRPLRFLSSDGIEMLCGRNNAQNDLVTLRLSRSTDTWLHAQGMPGSHVLIRAARVPEQTLRQAAHIAAFYSRGRRSENVPIDYTLIKHVRKPSGAKPGFVTYAFQKTLFITPDEALVKSLFAKDEPGA
ncbi:MAG: NFACT family protein [Christensenellales bacterium]